MLLVLQCNKDDLVGLSTRSQLHCMPPKLANECRNLKHHKT